MQAQTKIAVLVADEQKELVDQLTALINATQDMYVIEAVLNGTDLVSYFKTGKNGVDVALVDIGMPGMDGFEIARHIRATPEVAKVFLIAMTGYGSDRDQEKARDAGFDRFLVKPIDLALLQEWLRTMP